MLHTYSFTDIKYCYSNIGKSFSLVFLLKKILKQKKTVHREISVKNNSSARVTSMYNIYYTLTARGKERGLILMAGR